MGGALPVAWRHDPVFRGAAVAAGVTLALFLLRVAGPHAPELEPQTLTYTPSAVREVVPRPGTALPAAQPPADVPRIAPGASPVRRGGRPDSQRRPLRHLQAWKGPMTRPALLLSASLLVLPVAARAQAPTAVPPPSSTPAPSQLDRIEGRLDELLRRMDQPPPTALWGRPGRDGSCWGSNLPRRVWHPARGPWGGLQAGRARRGPCGAPRRQRPGGGAARQRGRLRL